MMERTLGALLRTSIILMSGLAGAAIAVALLGLLLWASWNNSVALFPDVPPVTWEQSLWFIVLSTTLRALWAINVAHGSKSK